MKRQRSKALTGGDSSDVVAHSSTKRAAPRLGSLPPAECGNAASMGSPSPSPKRQKKLPEFSPQAKCGGARRGLDGALETSDAPRSKAGVAPTKQPAQTTEPAVSKPGRPSSRGRLLVGALASKPSAAPCAAAVAPDDAAKPATANAAAAAATSSSPVVKLEHPAPPKAEATKSGEPYGAQRRAHDDLKRTLPLPDDYRRLQDSFVSLDTTLSFYRSRGEPAFFRPVCEAVQRSTSRAFSEATLRLLLGVWPEAFSVEAVAVAACRGRPATTDWLLGLPAPERQRGAATRSEERRAEFHTRLISLVRAEHDAWLQSLPPPTPEHASMSHERAWHPEFALNSCALPAEAELPDLSLVEAPPASRASQNAASVPRQTSRKTSEASSSDSATATLAEVAPPPAPATACVSSNAPEGCTGLSGSLIAKIKAKELAAQQDLATQVPPPPPSLAMSPGPWPLWLAQCALSAAAPRLPAARHRYGAHTCWSSSPRWHGRCARRC